MNEANTTLPPNRPLLLGNVTDTHPAERSPAEMHLGTAPVASVPEPWTWKRPQTPASPP